MNVALLEKIAGVIVAQPEQFNMTSFHCGTSHCIGGWAQAIAGTLHSSVEREYVSSTYDFNEWPEALLNISGEEGDRLFYADAWPKQFQGTAVPENVNPEDADDPCWYPTPQQAYDRIHHFIKTNGAE